MKINKELYDIQRISQKMIYEDAERDRAFDAYQMIYHNFWKLPEQIRNLPWIKKVISSDPYDAVNTGVRILSTLDHSMKYQPLAPGQGNKDAANNIERVLRWQLISANRRRSKSIEADVVKSALLYDATAVLVLDLDYQIKIKQAVNADSKREEAARRISRFAIQTFNPRHVHVRYSDIMPEAVLLVKHRHASEILDEWGDKAKAIPGLPEIAEKGITEDWVTYFDYWDLYKRAVWLAPGMMGSVPEATEDQSMVLLNAEPNELPFLPWVALMGGSTLEEDPEHKYMPLLYPVYTTGSWDVQNIVRTLSVSEAIATTGSPRYQESGSNPQHGEIDYADPARIAHPAPGNQFTPLQPADMSAALSSVDQLMSLAIDKQTVSKILQGGELPAGLAFATLNLATQSAVGVLKPAKDLSEKTLAEVYTLMLLWTEFTKKPMYAFSQKQEDLGTNLIVKPDEIDPQAIYITVELHPDAPTDRQQRVNTAALAVQQLYYPVENALEDIGVTDPKAAMKQRIKEMMLQNMMDVEFQKNMLMMQSQIQMQMQQAQMEMQQQMQQAQLQAQAQAMASAPQGGAPGAPQPMMGGPQGEAVNPDQGGQPYALFNPNETREMVTGEDFLGNEVEQ